MPKKRKRTFQHKMARQVAAFHKRVGRRIRDLRKERGGTIVSLGEAVGLSQAQISRLEKGQQGLRVRQLYKLARALGVNPKELLPG